MRIRSRGRAVGAGHRYWPLLAALLGSTVLLLSTAVASGPGGLSQKAGGSGCISSSTKSSVSVCRNAKALKGAGAVAVSPDGKNVYVASTGSAAVAIFDRTPSTGPSGG